MKQTPQLQDQEIPHCCNQTVLVIGGGFSGLVQAYYLVKAGFKVRVLEKENHWGGLLGTHKESGFLIEQAANAFLANAEIEEISHTIGCPLVPTLPSSRRRYIFRWYKANRWPLEIKDTCQLLLFLIKRLFGFKKNYGVRNDQESVQTWADRELSPSIRSYLLEPALQGIYAAQAHELNASLIVQSLYRRRKRGRLKGSVSPRQGMGSWVQAMVNWLSSQDVELELGVSQDQIANEIGERLKSQKPYLILACGLQSLKKMQEKELIVLPDSLRKTRLASLTSMQLFYQRSVSHLPGFGCLFPHNEKFNALGVLFNPFIFPGRAEKGYSETWIFNNQAQAFSQMSPMGLLRYTYSDRFLLFGRHEEPEFTRVFQWTERIPIYDQALSQFLKDYEKSDAKFYLIGNYLGDLGLSKIIFYGKNNAEKLKEFS